MNRETFILSQKELQRVAAIAACLKGQVAHASRVRPSSRRLSGPMLGAIFSVLKARIRIVAAAKRNVAQEV